MPNQKGFILPTTIIVLFLLCSFVSFQVTQYTIDKRLLKEEIEFYTAQQLLQKGVVEILNMLQTNRLDSNTGKLYYESGEVTYVLNKENAEVYLIQLVSKTLENNRQQTKFYYYTEDETVLPWLVEK